MVNNLKTKIANREDFVMKFVDTPITGDKVSPGWAEPTYDDFFTRMVKEPVLLNQSTVIPMTALQHDLDQLNVDVELDTQRVSVNGASSGLTVNETTPGFVRKQLLAQPLQAKTIITDNFLEENIEGQNFMNTYMTILSQAAGPAFERFGVFSKLGSSHVEGEGTGFQQTDGILAQLEAIKTAGKYKGIEDTAAFTTKTDGKFTDAIINGALDYIDQDGDINNARIILPPQIYARVMAEVAISRETDWGDAVFQDRSTTKIFGMDLVQDEVLKDARNGYGTYNTGKKVRFGFITKPENIVFGIMRDIETKNQYDIDVLGYKVALLVKGDVKVLYDQDTIAIPFDLGA